MSQQNFEQGRHFPAAPAQLNLIANPVAAALSPDGATQGLPPGSFIITGGMYGSGQERILVHTGGLPSAPPPVSQPQQLSPVFILPPVKFKFNR